MRRYIRNTIFGAGLLCLGAITAGCTEITIDFGKNSDNPGNITPESGQNKALVTFHASIEGRNMTRSVTSLGKNIQVQLYAFNGTDANADGTPVTQGLYQTDTPGLLSGISGYKMYLTNGIYNFYGVSENMSFSRISFTNGKSEPLLNSIDYLWWTAAQQDISSQQVSIPIVFLHSCTQVVFEVQAGNGVTINQLALAHISAPKSGASLDLTTGIIPPATEYETTMEKMGVNGLLAQYTMLPLKTDAPMQVSFDLIINGESTPRTYNTTVDIPDGELAAGNSYRFKAIINANTVEFPSVSVTNWVDVDETGKPLYPQQ